MTNFLKFMMTGKVKNYSPMAINQRNKVPSLMTKAMLSTMKKEKLKKNLQFYKKVGKKSNQ